MTRIVFLGPPGVGKGTQAEILSKELHVPHLSTGDLLRAAVAAGTPLGKEAQGHMDAGRLVPDDLVLRILNERLSEPDARDGFLLDGFPRNLAQAERLEGITRLDAVLSFELPANLLITRLSGRRVCPTCQTVYNVATRPPRVPGRCDRDGTELIQRPDDRPEAISTRLAVYAEQTAPLLGFYRNLGLLRPVDASGDPGVVAARVHAALR
ncbi:MAG: adenylate kinase [Thermoplasmata archaeon]